MTLAAFFTATLVFSMAGIAVLLFAKRFEMKTGKVAFGGVRPRIGAFFHALLVAIERAFPALVSRAVKRTTGYFAWFMHNGVARGVLAVEGGLRWVLTVLHYTTTNPPAQRTGKASVFLQEVAAHKKNLLKRSAPQVATEQ